MEDKIINVEALVLDTKTIVDVNIGISQDEWEQVINDLAEEIEAVIDEEFMEPFSEENDIKEAGYLDLDGFSHTCTGRQAYIATGLGYVGASAAVMSGSLSIVNLKKNAFTILALRMK